MSKGVSCKTKIFIGKKDAALNKKAGWDSNDLIGYTNNLIKFGRVEVGYRGSCGVTDRTALVWSKWIMVVKHLRKSGFEIEEETVKHGNSYATNKGGFWQSTIFRLRASDEK